MLIFPWIVSSPLEGLSVETIAQQNTTTYLQKTAKDKIDALKWEKPQDGTYRLILYRGGEQSTLRLTEKELLDCASEGWEE